MTWDVLLFDATILGHAIKVWMVTVQFVFLGYFALLSTIYLSLGVLAWLGLRRHRDTRSFDIVPRAHGNFNLPISVLVPAHNEAMGITASVRSLLQLDYPRFEILVINDGSGDDTLAMLIQHFDLELATEANEIRVPCQPIRGIYHSRRYPNLRVIDKVNGGKADALNAGINCSHYPLFCAVDADSILRRDALKRAVRPFLVDPRTIVAGATVAIANGCTIRNGQLEHIAIGRSLLAKFQLVEYLRAFLLGRLGWTQVNAVLIVSGAFGLFDKQVVIRAGGYRLRTIGEDMELIVRLHRQHLKSRKPYRVAYVPEPLCWTESPESLRVLRCQRMRWQRGLAESLTLHWSLLMHFRSATVGWLAMPFFIAFELLAPLIEVTGYAQLLIGALFGWVSWTVFGVFLLLGVSLGVLMSAIAIYLEATSSRLYPRPRQVLTLIGIAVLENRCYRQLDSLWRLQGLWRWAIRAQAQWGIMTRSAALGQTDVQPLR